MELTIDQYNAYIAFTEAIQADLQAQIAERTQRLDIVTRNVTEARMQRNILLGQISLTNGETTEWVNQIVVKTKGSYELLVRKPRKPTQVGAL